MWCNKCQRGQRENKDGTCPDCGDQIANPVEVVEEEKPSGILLQSGGANEEPSLGGVILSNVKQKEIAHKDMKRQDIMRLLKEMGIKFDISMKKNELIKLIPKEHKHFNVEIGVSG